MPPARRRTPAPGRRLALGLALTGVALTGCDATTACPAIGYGNVLTVALADGWPPDAGRTVHLECPGPCDVVAVRTGDGDSGDGASAPLNGASVSFPFTGGRPASVVVAVLDTAGTELARVETELEWVRVGGSEECGGPGEATVTVPAP